MNDVQRLIDAMGNAARRERARYHLTMGALIEALEKADPKASVSCDELHNPGGISSYRGYYEDIAFEPTDEAENVAGLLARCRAAMKTTLEGYKGGDFAVTEDKPLWLSSWGDCSNIAIVGSRVAGDKFILETKRVE